VTLTATPATSSTFTGWSGACSGTGSCVVTTNSSTSVTATFTTATFKPPKPCVVPNVKGKTLPIAKRALKAHYCSAGKITRSFSSKVKKGRVISQKPKPRSRRKHGAKVDLVVSKGKR
jgi:beta-lactam-binding protein with PASTA domain